MTTSIHSHNYAVAAGIMTGTMTTTTIDTTTNVDTHLIGNVYYVDGTNGNDGWDGKTLATAFKTFAKASSVVVDYDLVYVRVGTYYEIASFTKTIKFSNYNGESVILDGTGVNIVLHSGYGGMIEFLGTVGSHLPYGIDVSGITVQYIGQDTVHMYNAIYARYVDGIHIHDCITNDVVNSGIMLRNSKNFVINDNLVKNSSHATANMDECVSLMASTDGDVYDNEVHSKDIVAMSGMNIGIDAKAGCQRICIHDNYVHDVISSGVYADAWDVDTGYIYMYNNKVHDTHYGCSVNSENGGLLHDVYIYNNLVYRIKWLGFSIACANIGSGGLNNIYIYNNTGAKVLETWWSALRLDVTAARLSGTILIANNCFYWHDPDLGVNLVAGQICIKTGSQSKCTISNNIVYGENDEQGDADFPEATVGETWVDPLFTDWANNDFTLQAGSPCIGAGTVYLNLPIPDTDYAGDPRELNHTIDAGCYQG